MKMGTRKALRFEGTVVKMTKYLDFVGNTHDYDLVPGDVVFVTGKHVGSCIEVVSLATGAHGLVNRTVLVERCELLFDGRAMVKRSDEGRDVVASTHV